MVHVYTHIDLVLLVFMESHAFCMKTGTFCEKHWKATKTSDSTQISHYDLVFHRVQRECQLCICYILVVFGGACMCKWCMYTHILTWFCLFSWKVALFMKSTWKPLKSTWKATRTADSTHISYYDLVFCRVQREGQLDISYILVVFGGVCSACMFKWYMYTHILTWFCWFSWKVVLFMWKLVLLVKSTWKVKSTPEKWEAPEKWKAHEKHMMIEKKTHEKHTWKVKASKKWKAHEKLKHMKNTRKVKSTTFHEKHMLFIMSLSIMMDFTVDFICWFHYEFHYRFHRNGILS